jgi:peptidoglycan/LPS O-acetylase OafA/YrhL
MLTWLAERFELARGDQGHNVRSMEGLRGFAVFLVFLVHYVTVITPFLSEDSTARPIGQALHALGNAGVDLFFVLSGYLIYGSLISRPQPFRRFMRRRIERIYPTFLFVFAVYVGLSFVVATSSKIPPGLVGASGYLAANVLLLPGIFPIEPLIVVAWSLSYEMFYYLTIPLVIALLGLRDWPGMRRIALFATLAGVFIIWCSIYGAGKVRLTMFVAGILLYEIMTARLARAPGSLFAFGALAGGLLALLLPWSGPPGAAFRNTVLFVSFFILCFSSFATPTLLTGRLFSWTPLRWLGNMSYSYYLVHGLTLNTVFVVLRAIHLDGERGAVFFWLLMPVMLALSLVPSALLFLAVERPLSLKPHPAVRVRPAEARLAH